MPIVVGVRFRDSGKVYYFDPRGLDLCPGELIIVETVRGLELGKIAHEPREVSEEEIVGELKSVLRRPTVSDFERMQYYSARQEEVLPICAERIAQHKLPMRLIKAEYNFDGSRLTFYFTAEQRIDFRALVRDLARTFRTRIELRQVGPRDEARLLGGVGPCGRPLCCATFLPDFARVSIKMAKDQDLPLNPSKISGVCGRLLCCLSYEHEQYLEIKAELPPRGVWVQTPDGPGEVVAVNVVRETVTVDVGGNYIDVTAAQIAEATAIVADKARARVESGTAAPITREPLKLALYLEDDDAEVLRLLDEEEGVDGQLTAPSQPLPEPDDLNIEDGEYLLSGLPELHQIETPAPTADPDAQPEPKRRRRKRRRKTSKTKSSEQGNQSVQQPSAQQHSQQKDQNRAPQGDSTRQKSKTKRKARPLRRHR